MSTHRSSAPHAVDPVVGQVPGHRPGPDLSADSGADTGADTGTDTGTASTGAFPRSALLRDVPLEAAPEVEMLRGALLDAVGRQLGRVTALAATVRDSERVRDDQRTRGLHRLAHAEQSLVRLRDALASATTADGVVRLLAEARRERVLWTPRTRSRQGPIPADRSRPLSVEAAPG